MEETATGLCFCGCGKTTKIATMTVNRLGVKKGEHVRFIKGHRAHISPNDRFWKFVRKSESCWEWVGAKDQAGYGMIKDDSGKTIRAHRLSWELHNNQPIPEGLLSLHECDNPSCVNPAHLFIGTYKDNMVDCVTKGRNKTLFNDGVNNLNAKLAETDVLVIRNIRQLRGCTYQEIGDRFNISVSTVSEIVNRKIWDHI